MFNKIVIGILSIALIFSISITSKKPVFYGYADSFEVYLYENSSLAKMVNIKASEYPFLQKVKGESFKTNHNSFNLTEFLTNIKGNIVFTEEIEEGSSIYVFSNNIKYRKVLNENIVNIQIFIPNDIENSLITVGSPIIYGSF